MGARESGIESRGGIARRRDTIDGYSLVSGKLPCCDSPRVMLPGTWMNETAALGIEEDTLSRNLLCIGGTGSGKTNAVQHLVRGLKRGLGKNDVMIIFDTKGDYQREFFSDQAGDILLGTPRQFRDRTVIWNLLLDLLPDVAGPEDEYLMKISCDEAADGIFEKNKSTQQPFFANAAKSIFSSVLMTILQKALKESGYGTIDWKKQNNALLVLFIHRLLKEKNYEIYRQHPQLNVLYEYLGKGESNQALGVISELMLGVGQIFNGNFARAGSFSMREFVREKGGKTLFLEYDPTVGDTQDPVYSLIIDMALKEALCRTRSEGNVYLILDEFRLLPHMRHMDNALNFGRELGVKVIAGIQSIYQLFDQYGEYKAKTMISGFGSMFAFRPNDAATREFVRDYFGKNRFWETLARERMTPRSEVYEGFCVEDWEISGLTRGEAVIDLDAHPPFRFYFKRFTQGEYGR